MNIKVRQAHAKDLDRVLEIEQASFAKPWSRASVEESLDNEMNALWVADVDGAVAGYLIAFVTPTIDAEILRIATAPDYRRQSVAHNLINFMLCYCNLIASPNCLLEVRADNAAAIALYKSFSFGEDGIRKNYYGEGEDALLMSRVVSIETKMMELEYNK